MEILRSGKDEQWTDDNMRGRLNEIDYVANIPYQIIASLQITAKQPAENQQTEREI